MEQTSKKTKFFSSFLAYKKLPKETHLMGVAFFLDNLGALVTTLFTLILVEKKGLSTVDAGIFLSICFSVSLPMILFSGWIADRIGEKKIYLIFGFLAAATMLLLVPLFDHPISYFLLFLWPQVNYSKLKLSSFKVITDRPLLPFFFDDSFLFPSLLPVPRSVSL